MGNITNFISRWKSSGGSEQANSQLFLAELCDALDLSRPEPSKPVNEENVYSFERKVYIAFVQCVNVFSLTNCFQSVDRSVMPREAVMIDAVVLAMPFCVNTAL